MTFKIEVLIMLALCLLGRDVMAVQMGQKGLGQVLIYPYYTVNNNLNTLYTVVNTTEHPKAIKIRFLEGEIARDVLSYNVYMSPYDVWTGALVASESTVTGHVGEPSVLHLSTDTSCAPYLNKNEQEFLPFILDLNPSNNNLQRAREGHLEVIEMGVLTGEAAEAAVHSIGNGEPRNCGLFESAWANSEWELDELENPSGGLLGSASLINVAEGITFSYDAIALENFWNGAGIHTEPGSLSLDLSAAFPQSKALLTSGELAVSDWSTGYEAVSAVLMQEEVMNEYAFDAIVAGKSEWVLTFPTKTYHVAEDAEVLAPFEYTWDGEKSCDAFVMNIWDRAQQYQFIPAACQGSPCPPYDARPRVCYSSNVIEFKSPDNNPEEDSNILGSNNLLGLVIYPGSSATENGWAALHFDDIRSMTPDSGVGFEGLPVTGFMVQQFTNAGAQAGLLAQYGGLFVHKGLVVTTTAETE